MKEAFTTWLQAPPHGAIFMAVLGILVVVLFLWWIVSMTRDLTSFYSKKQKPYTVFDHLEFVVTALTWLVKGRRRW